VSGDGSVVVGYGSSGTTEEAFRWTPGDGIVGLGTLLGDMASNAMGVSADGSVVVGSSFFQDADVLRNEPYRWTAATGMVDIGQLPGANYSNVRGISPNGSVIVGEGIRIDYPAGSFVWTEAFRWTSGSGMVGLGFLPGGRDLPLPFSEAVATSADGLRVVGQARSVDGADIAMIWDPIHGMRSLQDVLVNDYGLDLTGWTLGGATAISADGRTIAGFGTSPSGQFQGWIAVLPDPSEATVCHKGRKTLTLDAHAAAAHLAHGDSAGACSD
jgi:probable HAF family extracellular repeat protein